MKAVLFNWCTHLNYRNKVQVQHTLSNFSKTSYHFQIKDLEKEQRKTHS